MSTTLLCFKRKKARVGFECCKGYDGTGQFCVAAGYCWPRLLTSHLLRVLDHILRRPEEVLRISEGLELSVSSQHL